MRRFRGIVRLLAGSLLVLTFSLTACTQETPPAVESPAENGDNGPAETTTDNLSSLFENDLALQIWLDRGIANVKSVSAAEQLAGYPVAAPSYVPDGFTLRSVSYEASGAGMPEDRKPKWDNSKVTQMYGWGDGTDGYVQLIQAPHKFGNDGEPYESNGWSATRRYDDSASAKPPMLDFVWEIDGRFFDITGWLSGPLDEATLVKIASSVAF
jgi:hypothetical protein